MLRNKEHYKPAYRMPARPLMVGIAMVITGTLIWSTFIWAPLAGIACAVIAVVTGLPVYYFWENQNKKAAGK